MNKLNNKYRIYPLKIKKNITKENKKKLETVHVHKLKIQYC